MSGVGLHFELQAYVCGPGGIRPSPFEGWATFAQIYGARPEECRFAVVRRVPLVARPLGGVTTGEPTGDYLVWDFYHDNILIHQRHRTDGLLRPPPATWCGESKDGMIMKAMMLYDRE